MAKKTEGKKTVSVRLLPTDMKRLDKAASKDGRLAGNLAARLVLEGLDRVENGVVERRKSA